MRMDLCRVRIAFAHHIAVTIAHRIANTSE